MIALERQEEMLREAAPRVTGRGHLELVDWELPKTALPAPTAAVRVNAPVNPRRLPIDRVFESGVLLLLASSVAAVCACMGHL